jgi:catechol 2,3-dioxygenase-like lactoylglutathione lyase family enzyme
MMQLAEMAFFTDSVADMIAFYRRLLAAEPVARSDDMAVFQVGPTRIFIHRNYRPGEGELPPEQHMAFAVEDLDAACRTLRGLGLGLEVEPRDYYWGRSAYLRDPDGHLIELSEMEGVD